MYDILQNDCYHAMIHVDQYFFGTNVDQYFSHDLFENNILL